MYRSPLPSSPLTRRSLLAGAATAAVAAGTGLVAGCSSGAAHNQPSAGASAVTLPTYEPYTAVKPDLPPHNQYGTPGFLKFPNPVPRAVSEKPGDGSTISAFTNTSIAAPPPMAQDGWWTNVNAEVGATMALEWLKGAEYTAKVQTILAGGQLPDIMMLPPLPRLAQILSAKFADLSPYLAGNAVKEYPLLANYPTASWREVVFNNQIAGVPRPSLPISSRVEARTDTLQKLGITSLELKDGNAFLDLCRAVTDRAAGRFAMIQPTAVFLKNMFDLPNNWEKTSSGFRNEIESERFPDYLNFVAKMWKDGLFHPDSFQAVQYIPMFQKPAFVLFEIGGAGFARAMSLYRPGAPTLTVRPVVIPLIGGGQAPVRIGAATSNMLVLNKQLPADRIKMILRVLNFCAAPFGTKEFLTVQYGKEGHNYSFDAHGEPVSNPKFTNELFPITLFPGAPAHYYGQGFPDLVKAECAYDARVSEKVILDAAQGLYSETAIASQATLTRDVTDAVGDIIQGRRPVSSWPEVVKQWAAKGGDQIRKEYEALQ